MVLYCKSAPVYDIDKEEVIAKGLLPGIMRVYGADSTTFTLWSKSRYSSQTNGIARRLGSKIVGVGKRFKMNELSHMFSLSDCYWVGKEGESNRFKELSPYYVTFWKGDGVYNGKAVPTLYVGGYLNKEWRNSKDLVKYGVNSLNEIPCYNLCKACGVSVAEIHKEEDHIIVKNFTSDSLFLEQADQSGLLNPDDFSEEDIVSLFGWKGLQMLLIDAIVGNGDRHAGNFGWLRSTDTGEYVKMAPLYDFDHAFDSTSNSDILISDVSKIASRLFSSMAISLVKTAIDANICDTFSSRAKTILNNISGGSF